MKHYITYVVALLLAGMLAACGGGGDDSSSGGGTPGTTTTGGTPGTTTGGNPGTTTGGDPGTTTGGGTTPGTTTGSDPGTTTGGTPGTTAGGDPGTTAGGDPGTTTGGGTTPGTTTGSDPGTTTGGDPGTTTGGDPGTTTGGTPGTTTGGDPGTTTGGGTTPGTTTGGDPGTTTGGTPGTTPGGPGGGVGTFPSAGRVEESDTAAVTFSAGWTKANPLYGWSGGSARRSSVTGATVSFKFIGTSIRWIGEASPDGGIALVSVDGGTRLGENLFEVDLRSDVREARTPVFSINDLPPGQHTLKIEVTGRQNEQGSGAALVVVDAFDIDPPSVSHLQETDPDVAVTGIWVRADSTATPLKDFKWSGCCVYSGKPPAIGGAVVSETAGSKLTLKFRGTAISWIGYRGPNGGIARVQVNGGPAREIDTYSPTVKIHEVMFTETGLADNSFAAPGTEHTLTIEATGLKNPAAATAHVVVDAFDVTRPGRRYDNLSQKIIYTGDWGPPNANRAWSEVGAATASQALASAMFSFKGTGIRWIGCVKSSIGRANVYIDGALQTPQPISGFRRAPIEGYHYVMFRKDGLSDGEHTIMIEVVGNGIVVVDAFDVVP